MLAPSVLFSPLFTSAYSLITYSLPQCQLKQRPCLTAVQSQDMQRKLKAPLKVFVRDTLSRYFYILKKSLRNKFLNEFQFNKVDDELILTVKSISRIIHMLTLPQILCYKVYKYCNSYTQYQPNLLTFFIVKKILKAHHSVRVLHTASKESMN